MLNNQCLMAECLATHYASRSPCPDTLHLLNAEREVSKKNWDFEMKSVAITRHIRCC
jgi:hypothetical protein